MKPADKLNLIKLVSSQMFVQERIRAITAGEYWQESRFEKPRLAIQEAVLFVEEFETFEDKFMKENGVKDDSKD